MSNNRSCTQSLDLIGNQCKSLKIGVACGRFDDFRKQSWPTNSALSCSLEMFSFVMPVRGVSCNNRVSSKRWPMLRYSRYPWYSEDSDLTQHARYIASRMSCTNSSACLSNVRSPFGCEWTPRLFEVILRDLLLYTALEPWRGDQRS